MSDLASIPYIPAKTEMAAMRFTQSKTGHVHSPWFTFDWTAEAVDGKPFHGMFNSRTSQILQAAITAFAEVLDIDRNAVVTTMMKDPADHFETKWRLGTAGPCALPYPPKQRASLARNGDIEIESIKVQGKLK